MSVFTFFSHSDIFIISCVNGNGNAQLKDGNRLSSLHVLSFKVRKRRKQERDVLLFSPFR